MSTGCIAELPDVHLDIVGDIHGELDALTSLLKRLGYDDLGRHPENRKLVFVGDLIDRGPDSPGVLRGIGHSSSLLAQRPSMGVMLNP